MNSSLRVLSSSVRHRGWLADARHIAPRAFSSAHSLAAQHKVVVIGGGVVGTSVLYHLAKLGWSDVALLERKVLTAGSTWHAAGGFHALNSDPTVSALQSYTINLYREIEELSGQSCGLKYTGGTNFACTEERWQYLRNEWAKHRTMGIDSVLLTPEECKERCPILDTTHVIGGLFDANEGYLDCSGVTWAFAKSAQHHGATIHQHTKVESLKQLSNGSWEVVTDKGVCVAEHVVNCGGLWAREVGAMAGVHLPLLPMQHHYLITEDLKDDNGLFFAIDLDGENYIRSERGGVLLGVYEPDCRPWASDATPWDYGEDELLPPDLDRISPQLEKAYSRYPVLEQAGVRSVVNGAFTFAPDGNPLIGPIQGTGLASAAPSCDVRNYWVACAVMAGFAQGGGVGLCLAEWMIHGRAQSYPDIFAMDVARFGRWASKAYTLQKSQENYSRRFRISYPNEELPAARGLKMSPLHAHMESAGANFGASYGLEYAKYFSADTPETYSLCRSNVFPIVAQEVAAVRNKVGLLEMSTFSKYEVTGPESRRWLDRLLACKVPPAGRMALAPMLAFDGTLMGDLTVMSTKDGDTDRFLLLGSGYLQAFHMRHFTQQLEDWQGVSVRNVTDEVGGLALAGPRSRELLETLVLDPSAVSHDAMRFMAVRSMDIGLVPAIVARVSVTGELGYEITTQANFLPGLYQAIVAAGEGLGLTHVGSYALNSLRLEKGFGIWSREFTPEFTPRMSGMDRFVAYDKASDFIGKAAAAAERSAPPPKKKLVTLEVHGTSGADAWGYEPVWTADGQKNVGFTTSGGYGHTVGKSLAMAYVDPDAATDPAGLSVHILAERLPATVLPEPAWDPKGLRMLGADPSAAAAP